jgi:hypothetical protein
MRSVRLCRSSHPNVCYAPGYEGVIDKVEKGAH